MPIGGSSARTAETSVYATREAMQEDLLKYVQAMVDVQIRMPGYISIGLSGGSMPKILGPVLARLRVDPDRLRLILVDERIVDHAHPDSNYGQWAAALPKDLAARSLVPADLIDLAYRADKTAYQYDVGRTALAYELKIKNTVGPEVHGKFPRFDMLFLGMGPDGHTASIFPSSKLFRLKMDTTMWFAGVEDSPKQPPQRLTLTMAAINASAHVAFICTGEDKATVLKSVLDREPQYPASHVAPHNGKLRFFLDEPAAAKL